MAATDARPVPLKNTAYRITFPMRNASGDLVAGASTKDSEISKDGGTFVDCTNEAIEIASSSGFYFLDLTSTEMNADTVAIKVTADTVKTVAVVLYPQEGQDIKVHVMSFEPGSFNNAAINADINEDGANEIADAMFARALPEGYAADNVVPTFAQMMYMLHANLSEFSISGTTITAKKIDGTTTAMTYTLNDATNPTSRTRTT